MALLSLGFIAVTAWWLAVDQRAPDGDAGRHLLVAFEFRRNVLEGFELYWFRYEPDQGAVYPPLVFIVGAVGLVLSGLSADAPIMALNVVFVPLLVVGCYGVGRIAFGQRAGILAAVFALATPVVIAQFHIFLLDLPLTAMVAATAAALLATDRFADRRFAVAAGVLAGLGLLTKQSFVIFVAPLALVIIARGGYRNWRNVLICAGLAAAIAAPWYLQHLDAFTRNVGEATSQGEAINPYGPEYTRWSLSNFASYGWTALNIHYFLPLILFYLAGLVHALVSWRRSGRAGYAPELVVGSLGSYLGVALLWGFQDPRYSIPAVVFVAALGTGWISSLGPRARLAATATLAAVLVCNMLAINLGTFGTVDVALPGADDPGREWAERRVVVIRTVGYSSGPADEAGRTLELLRAARRDGVALYAYEPTPDTVSHVSPNGLFYFGIVSKVSLVSPQDVPAHKRRAILLTVRPVQPGDPRPCTRFKDGKGLYVTRGVALTPSPRDQRGFYCPL